MTKRSLTFALGATLLLSGSTAAVSATPHTLSRYCAVDLNSLCAGIKPGEGRIHAPTVAHQRTLCGVLGKAFQGRLGSKRVPRGYPTFLPPRRLWEHCKLHEAASWRGQRSLQRSAGVRRLPGQRSVTLSDPTLSLLRDWTLPSRERTLKSRKVLQRNRSGYSTHDKVAL